MSGHTSHDTHTQLETSRSVLAVLAVGAVAAGAPHHRDALKVAPRHFCLLTLPFVKSAQ
jgi:hypothetical protein